MKVKALVKDLPIVVKGKDVDISGISLDSRTVSPGNLFISKKGGYIEEAIRAGAAAIATDLYDPFVKVTQLICKDQEAKLAAKFYGPKDLFMVGVTGTKGKTTTTYLIKHLLGECGLIGTIESVVGDIRRASNLTTQDVVTNHKLLREMARAGCKSCAMEVSSHGLDQGRVDEIEFDVGVFTNLYPDHLDYHKTVDAYFDAKKKLLTRSKKVISNADLAVGGLTYGIDQGDIRAENIILAPDHTEFTVEGVPFYSPLIGKFNVYNALAAICVGMEKGIDDLPGRLKTFVAPPARLERIGNVFIDFAHEGESLANVLETLKNVAKGRVIVVFGCGGDRDPGRRVGMGKAAARLADVSIITTDNPRSEDPAQIAEQIVAQFETRPIIELDRKKAIMTALEMATKDDLVLIAGKGHEKVQIFANRTVPFDDLEVVCNFNRAMRI